jgi:hypothetical protein
MREFLGAESDQIVSPATAENMARAAYAKAVRLRPEDAPVVGIGATAAISSDRPKKGDHRCVAASWTDRAVTTFGLTFVKGLRDRAAEDKLVSRIVVRALAEACELDADLTLELDGSEEIGINRRSHDDPIEELLRGAVDSVTVLPNGTLLADRPSRGGVLAGSFDPFHEGHSALARVGAEIVGAEVVFELSVFNVDKPLLTRAEIDKRLGQFAGVGTVVLSRAPTFRDKAELFPGCTFIVGWDTAVRLVEPSYYGGDEAEMAKALAAIRNRGCRFLVAGRLDEGDFHTLAEVRMPDGLEDLVSAIPEAAFRHDLSSTELRLAGPTR